MKKFIKIQLVATLAAALSMAGVASGQTSEVSSGASALSDPQTLSPAAAAFVYYFRIQTALAQDSLTNVAANAAALANAVRNDGTFPAQFADQAIALARDAVTLPGARLDFAIVSGQLINYLKVRNPPVGLVGPIRQVYDPQTKLYWLQTGDVVQNPYLGKSWGRATVKN